MSTLRQSGAALFGDVRRAVYVMAGVLALLWLVLLLNTLVFGGQLDRYGIEPRTSTGLRGILLAPLLHLNVAHLAANSMGLLFLGGLVLLRRERDFWIVMFCGVVLGGACTWLFARHAMHIGASGVVFAYLGYLLSTGIFERRLGGVLVSLVAGFAWGGLVFGVLPGQREVSWESHLFGLVAGVVAAWLIAGRRGRRSAAF